MNIVAYVPARSGSKTILNKNIKELGGKPLISWSIESAFKAGIERVILDTDSDEYAEIGRQYGAEIFIRPYGLNKDNTSMYDLLRIQIPTIKPEPDLILLLQPTTPFRENVHIKTAISYLQENIDKYDSLISVEKVPEKYNPSQVIVSNQGKKNMVLGKIKSWFKKDKFILTGVPLSKRMTRRQEYPDAWIPTGSIYLFKASNLKKGSIYGDNIMLLETEPTININTQDDWDIVEEICKNKVS